MPKSMVTAVGFSARTWAAKRRAPPVAVSPPMPALRKVRPHLGKRVVRYSSMSVEYWYWAVMLSPRKKMRSPFWKKNLSLSAAARPPAATSTTSAARGAQVFLMAVLSWQGWLGQACSTGAAAGEQGFS
jgi:hypothetical protein